MELDEGKSKEDATDEVITKGFAAHEDSGSSDEDVDDGDEIKGCARGTQSEMRLNDLVNFTDNETANCSGKTQLHSPGNLSPSYQAVHRRKSEDRASPRRGSLAGSSGCFPWLPPLKLVGPKGLQVVENFITAEVLTLSYCIEVAAYSPLP